MINAMLEIPQFDPKSNQESHKKSYYDLESIQKKLWITQRDVDSAWAYRKDREPVYLCYAMDRHFWISNYEN